MIGCLIPNSSVTGVFMTCGEAGMIVRDIKCSRKKEEWLAEEQKERRP